MTQMRVMRNWIVLIFCLASTFVQAQKHSSAVLLKELQDSTATGSVVVVQDMALDKLMDIHFAARDRNKGVDGFRIQLYLGSNNNAKNEAAEVKTKFLSEYPQDDVYVMYEAPFWRVQAGDFRSKGDALKMLHRLKKLFPSCYPVPVTDVDYTKFDKN